MEAIGEKMLDESSRMHFFFAMHKGLFAALPVDVVKAWLKHVGVEGARHIARHLPTPNVDENGAAVVPELSEFVLREFESDDRTFQEFCAGVNSHKSYLGDIASQVESEGALAKRFLTYPLNRIKQWARLEAQSSTKEAEMWRRVEEEQKIR